jgi:hypothetical protein
MFPLAPGRFSTTSFSPSAAATARASRSVLMPAANGQMMVTGRVGQAAAAGSDVDGSAARAGAAAIIHAAVVATAKCLNNARSPRPRACGSPLFISAEFYRLSR